MAKRVPTGVADVTGVVRRVLEHPANQDARLRQLGRASWFRLRALFGLPTIVRLGQRSRLRASLAHASSILVAYSNPPDLYEWQVWQRILQRGDRFVDVGANVGIYSILAAELGCSVTAFEPDPMNLEELGFNLGLNELADKVSVVPKAVAARSGTVLFLAGHDAVGRIAVSQAPDSITVECVALDDALEGAVAGMKIDVEGAEHLVLQGAEGMLRAQSIGVIQLEWNETSRANFDVDRSQVGTFLEEHGYVIAKAGPSGGLRRVDPAIASGEVFALSRAAAIRLLD